MVNKLLSYVSALCLLFSILYFTSCDEEETIKRSKKPSQASLKSDSDSTQSSDEDSENNEENDESGDDPDTPASEDEKDESSQPPKLVFTTQPTESVNVDTVLPTQPKVSIQDQENNVLSKNNVEITLDVYTDKECSTKASGQISLDKNPVSTSNGEASFANISYNTVEIIYLGVSSADITSACSNAINVKKADGSSPSKLVYSTALGSSETAGSNFTTAPTISVNDDNNEKVLAGTYTVSLTAHTDSNCSSDQTAPGTLQGASGDTFDGEVTFSNLRYDTARTIYIKASTNGLTSVCSSALTINPAVANKLSFSVQPSSSGTVGTALSTSPKVKIYDAFDNLVTNQQVNVTLTAATASDCSSSSTKSGLTASSNPVASSNGEASFSEVTYDTAESIYLQASSDSLTAGCSNQITFGSGESPSGSFEVSGISVLGTEGGNPVKKFANSANCQGAQNISPAVSWSGVPSGTQEFILIMDDSFDSGQTFLHWIIQFPSDTTSLPENISGDENPSEVTGARQGSNGFSNIGWGGPSPPSADHSYRITLYALSSALGDNLDMSMVTSSRDDLENNALSGVSYQKAEVSITLGPPCQ